MKWNHFEVKTIPALYPCGAEEILKWILERRGDPPGRPYGQVYNAAAAFSVYEAVALQKPFYERPVTVGGECVTQPRNLWARIGTEFGDLVKACRGLLREPRKVVMNGPMRGTAQSSLEVPVIPGTQGILALPKEAAKPAPPEACTRCGRCLEVCPVEISPAMITLAAENDFFELAEEYGVGECIECGNCAYVCPSKRPMVELIRYAESNLQ